MAYMNKTTFELYDLGVAEKYDDPDFYEHHFHVDDPIALPIQELNRKGYTTLECCCGHPFTALTLYRMKTKTQKTTFSFVSFAKNIVLPSLPSGFKLKNPEKRFYITGADGTFDFYTADEYIKQLENRKLPIPKETRDMLVNLPPMIAGTIIDKQYNCDGFELMREILDSMETLYQWALELPDFVTQN